MMARLDKRRQQAISSASKIIRTYGPRMITAQTHGLDGRTASIDLGSRPRSNGVTTIFTHLPTRR